MTQTLPGILIAATLLVGLPVAEVRSAALQFDEHLIMDNYAYPYGIAAGDLDGDGDIDLTSADANPHNALYWFQNDGAGRFKRHFIQRDDPERLERHAIGDIDGDGHLDVVIVKNLHGDLLWFRNSGHPGDGELWQRHIITRGKLPGAYQVALFDADGDGDLDVAGSGWKYGNQFAWFENDGTPAADQWQKHLIEADLRETRAILAADLDGDGDLDLVGAGTGAALVVWYENHGGPGTPQFKKHVIDGQTPKPAHGQAVDMDGDGDPDVLMAFGKNKAKYGSRDDNHVAWYENDGRGGDGGWKKHEIGRLPGAFEAVAADLDGDGDQDVVASAWDKPGQILWYENRGDARGPWIRHMIRDNWERANQVIIADFDGDRRPDIAAIAEHGSYEFRWWRNVGVRPAAEARMNVVKAIEPKAAQNESGPLNIGSRLELFVDHYLVDTLHNARLRLHHPRREGVAIRFDQPWEGICSGHVTIILDRGKYRMYYRGWPYKPELRDGSAPGQAQHVACYAESDDGIHWVKPHLRIHEVNGTLDNNVVISDAPAVTGRFSPFLDTRSGVPEHERYKAVSTIPGGGLGVLVSADGLRWKQLSDKPIITGFAFDSQNTIFWSEAEGCYVCFFRTKKYFRTDDGAGKYVKLKDGSGTMKRRSTWQGMKPKPEIDGDYNRFRWITRFVSTDLENWSAPVDMDFGDAPLEHLYTNQTEPYFRAPHIYIGTAARFFPGRWALTEAQIEASDLNSPRNYYGVRPAERGKSLSDAVLLTSRGKNRYDRTFVDALVRPSSDPRDWTSRSNYPARGVVPTGEREMSMYITRNYGQPSAYLERLSFRTDGFVSVHAPYEGGELITKPLIFSGKHLVLNFATSAAGSVRVEVQAESGMAVPGFALEDCPEIIGDDIERVVRWRSGDDVGPLSGKPLRLRLLLRDADLYSLRFR